MTESYVRKFKWFWIWQDDKEEVWLRKMSEQGLHLKSTGLLGQYLFERGERREYSYQLDFMTESKKQDDYVRALQDAGCEYVGRLGSWHNWRKAIKPGETPEIHPDPESKIQKYQRVLGVLIIFLPIFTVLITRADDVMSRYEHWGIGIIFGVFYAFFLMYIFALLMIFRRILTLKRTAKEK
jgi:hypothetical protein